MGAVLLRGPLYRYDPPVIRGAISSPLPWPAVSRVARGVRHATRRSARHSLLGSCRRLRGRAGAPVQPQRCWPRPRGRPGEAQRVRSAPPAPSPDHLQVPGQLWGLPAADWGTGQMLGGPRLADLGLFLPLHRGVWAPPNMGSPRFALRGAQPLLFRVQTPAHAADARSPGRPPSCTGRLPARSLRSRGRVWAPEPLGPRRWDRLIDSR